MREFPVLPGKLSTKSIGKHLLGRCRNNRLRLFLLHYAFCDCKRTGCLDYPVPEGERCLDNAGFIDRYMVNIYLHLTLQIRNEAIAVGAV